MRAWILVLLGGCLERVTGEEVPLDPRFYEAIEASQGSPGQGGGTSVPFHDHEGERVEVSGIITSELDLGIDLDVRVPDASQPGGVAQKGKLLIETPGPFSLMVPKGLGRLELQAFQDQTADGPSGDDPFGQVSLTVADVPLTDVLLALEAGKHVGGGGGPEHKEAAPGAPGGGGHGGGLPGPGTERDPFEGVEGPRVKVRGVITYEGQGVVDLDLFQPDENAPGGRRMLAKLKRNPGPWDLDAPADFGPLLIEAIVDLDSDGPSPGDPMDRRNNIPVVVGDDDVEGIHFVLVATPPENDPAPGGPGAPSGGLEGEDPGEDPAVDPLQP